MNVENVEKTESKSILAGMFLTGVVFAIVAILTIHQMGFLREFSMVFSIQFLSGREFAMLNGAAQNIPVFVLILVSFISDMAAMLIGLPVFVLFHAELRSIPLMAPFMNFSEIITSNKSGILHKFGLMGLFIICFIPFQMTGGLATACFAKLLGFTVREILAVVSVASLFASVFWAMTADTVMKYLGPVQHYIPYFIVVVVVAIIIYNFTYYTKR